MPFLGSIILAKALIKLDLPLPVLPTKQTFSLFFIFKLIFFNISGVLGLYLAKFYIYKYIDFFKYYIFIIYILYLLFNQL